MIHRKATAGKPAVIIAVVTAFCIAGLISSCGKNNDNSTPSITNTDSLTANVCKELTRGERSHLIPAGNAGDAADKRTIFHPSI